MERKTTAASLAPVLLAAVTQVTGCASLKPEFMPVVEKAPNPALLLDTCGELTKRVTVLNKGDLAATFPAEIEKHLKKSPTGFCINREGDLVIDGVLSQICTSDDGQRHSAVVVADLKAPNHFSYGIALTLSDKSSQSFSVSRVETRTGNLWPSADYKEIGKTFCERRPIDGLLFPKQW